MNTNQEQIQVSETAFHRRSAKFFCRPCNRQFNCVNPENGQAACPRCEGYSNLMIEDAQQSPIQQTVQNDTQAATQAQTQPQQQPQPQQQQQQRPRYVQVIRQTIFAPGQTIFIETTSPQVFVDAPQPSQSSGNILNNLFGGLSNIFGLNQQPAQNRNPADLFGEPAPQQQNTQQNFFGASPLNLFFMPAPMMFFSHSDYERLIQEFLRNDPNNHGPAPADEKSINSLKEFEYGTTTCKNTDCSVCQDDYKSGDKCVSLPCEHTYHKDCVVEWLKRHDSCPVCRKSISSNKQGAAADRMEEEVSQPQQQAGF